MKCQHQTNPSVSSLLVTHDDADVLHLPTSRSTTLCRPIYHRLCRVTLVFVSQPPSSALLRFERHSCGHSIKVRLGEAVQLPGTSLSTASDRWPELRCRCESAAGVCKFLTSKHTLFAPSGPHLAALVVLLVSSPLLPSPAELSLRFQWLAVILTPTLHVTGRACEL